MLEIIAFIVEMPLDHSFDSQQMLSCFHVQLGVMSLLFRLEIDFPEDLTITRSLEDSGR